MRLLECASFVIADEGSSGLTIRSFATRAKVSPGLITRYFPRVDEIYPQVIAYIFENYFRVVPPELAAKTGRARLVGSMEFSFQYFAFDNIHHTLCINHAYIYARNNKQVGQILHQAVFGSVGRLRERTQKMLSEAGLSASDKEIDLFAHFVMQILDGALMHVTLLPKNERKEFAEKFFESFNARIDDFLARSSI